MVDFWVDFNLSDTVLTELRSNKIYSSYADDRVHPDFFVNATHVAGTPHHYRIDYAVGTGQLETRQELADYLDVMVPWFRLYQEIGIKDKIDALVFSENGQRVVTTLFGM